MTQFADIPICHNEWNLMLLLCNCMASGDGAPSAPAVAHSPVLCINVCFRGWRIWSTARKAKLWKSACVWSLLEFNVLFREPTSFRFKSTSSSCATRLSMEHELWCLISLLHSPKCAFYLHPLSNTFINILFMRNAFIKILKVKVLLKNSWQKTCL